MLRRTLSIIRTRSCCYGTVQSLPIQSTAFNSKHEVENLCHRVKDLLQPVSPALRQLTHYHFDSSGKAVRPLLTSLVAASHNSHWLLSRAPDSPSLLRPAPSGGLLDSQRCVATVSEMIHVASLVHDDLIDQSAVRRGKASVQAAYGPRRAVLAGDYILAKASESLAKNCNEEVVRTLAQVIEDLIRGEFMQMGSRETDEERFAHYLRKTYHKTASLMANSCKAVAILASDLSDDASAASALVDSAFRFGRHVGLAFQLLDDVLDFCATQEQLGKPVGADLELGLATGPVLFAAQEYPELNEVIMRRFSEPGDVELTLRLVGLSDGIQQTRLMAETHVRGALTELDNLRPSAPSNELTQLVHRLSSRTR